MARKTQQQKRAAAAPHQGGTAARPTAKGSRSRWITAVAALAVAAAAFWWWWDFRQAEAGFEALVKSGQPALSRVERIPAEASTGHLRPGESIRYRQDPPTSGRHHATPLNSGVYDAPPSPTMLVHSLEHGHVVIYYDRPEEADLVLLTGWARLFTGHWSGVVLTPRPGLGKKIILTAWRRILRLDRLEPQAAAAFIDRFRGRGPENPVR